MRDAMSNVQCSKARLMPLSESASIEMNSRDSTMCNPFRKIQFSPIECNIEYFDFRSELSETTDNFFESKNVVHSFSTAIDTA